MQYNTGIDNNCSVIILAAGFGTRMLSDTPKILHKICGKEMLFCVIDNVKIISDDIHIVLFNKADIIINLLEINYPNTKFNIHIQNYNNFPGTAGAIMKGKGKNPKELINIKYEQVLILSADMPLITESTLKKFINLDLKASIGVLTIDNAVGYGRVIINNGIVEGIIEDKDASIDTKHINLVNAGIYCFKKDLLNKYLSALNNNNSQKEFYLTDIVGLIAKENIINVIYGNMNEFMGVNSKTELAQAERFILDRLRNIAMKKGVIFHIPDTIYIDFDTEFFGECEIDSNVVLKGANKITNSHIKANSVIEDSNINNSSVGPFARIRPKSLIKDSHIGNFVEIKASKLFGVKVGHLSYIGDSEIGNGTNIGAGVITCNYDGKAKHKTIIGENVFVGSGTQLIAPIKIESNSLIAAGSVINKNVNEGDLAISRSKQENKKGFFYSFFGNKN